MRKSLQPNNASIELYLKIAKAAFFIFSQSAYTCEGRMMGSVNFVKRALDGNIQSLKKALGEKGFRELKKSCEQLYEIVKTNPQMELTTLAREIENLQADLKKFETIKVGAKQERLQVAIQERINSAQAKILETKNKLLSNSDIQRAAKIIGIDASNLISNFSMNIVTLQKNPFELINFDDIRFIGALIFEFLSKSIKLIFSRVGLNFDATGEFRMTSGVNVKFSLYDFCKNFALWELQWEVESVVVNFQSEPISVVDCYYQQTYRKRQPKSALKREASLPPPPKKEEETDTSLKEFFLAVTPFYPKKLFEEIQKDPYRFFCMIDYLIDKSFVSDLIKFEPNWAKNAIIEGATLLMLCTMRDVESDNFEIFELLLDAGANLLAKTVLGVDAITIAIVNNNKPLVEYFYTRLTKEIIGERFNKDHTDALRAASADVALYLLERDEATPEQKAIMGRFLYLQNYTAVRHLCEMGYVIQIKDLYAALQLGESDFFEEFYNVFKREKNRDLFKEYALGVFIFAINYQSARSIVFLLRQNEGVYDLNQLMLEKYSMTALTMAIKYEFYQSALVLINNGADVNFSDEFGHLPLDLAIAYGSVDVTRSLLKHGAVAESRILHLAATHKNVDVCKMLVREFNHSATVIFENEPAFLRILKYCPDPELVQLCLERHGFQLLGNQLQFLSFAIYHRAPLATLECMIKFARPGNNAGIRIRGSVYTLSDIASFHQYSDAIKILLEKQGLVSKSFSAEDEIAAGLPKPAANNSIPLEPLRGRGIPNEDAIILARQLSQNSVDNLDEPKAATVIDAYFSERNKLIAVLQDLQQKAKVLEGIHLSSLGDEKLVAMSLRALSNRAQRDSYKCQMGHAQREEKTSAHSSNRNILLSFPTNAHYEGDFSFKDISSYYLLCGERLNERYLMVCDKLDELIGDYEKHAHHLEQFKPFFASPKISASSGLKNIGSSGLSAKLKTLNAELVLPIMWEIKRKGTDERILVAELAPHGCGKIILIPVIYLSRGLHDERLRSHKVEVLQAGKLLANNNSLACGQ